MVFEDSDSEEGATSEVVDVVNNIIVLFE